MTSNVHPTDEQKGSVSKAAFMHSLAEARDEANQDGFTSIEEVLAQISDTISAAE